MNNNVLLCFVSPQPTTISTACSPTPDPMAITVKPNLSHTSFSRASQWCWAAQRLRSAPSSPRKRQVPPLPRNLVEMRSQRSTWLYGNIPDDVVVRKKASFIDPMPRISDQNESLWELLAQRVKNSWFLTAGGSLFLCRTLAIREFHVRAPPAGYRHVRSCRAAELQPGSGVEAINRVLHNL